MSRAVGHIPGTALPGNVGNVGLAGHRDTFFRVLRNIRRDDTIELETTTGTYRYVVHSTRIVTPRDVEGTDSVHVARLRQEDASHFALWCVGDQLRKGAATNAVEILQLLLEKGYVSA